MTPVFVQVPCRRFRVLVKLGPPDGIGHLEALILRRLALATAPLADLASFFSLPESIVLDRVVALFRRGLVTLASGDSHLNVDPVVLRAMKNPADPATDWQRTLGLEGSISKEVELLREMVSGAVFARPKYDRTRLDFQLPPCLDLPPVGDIPKPVLLSAASSRLREEGAGFKKLRAFDVACVGGAESATTVATPEAYDFIVVEVVGSELDGEHPTFTVVGPPQVSRRVRDAIANGISALHERGLVDPLVTKLKAASSVDVETSSAATGDVEFLTASLRAVVVGMSTEATHNVFREGHERATMFARELDDQLSLEAAHEGRAELVVGARAHRRLLLDVLRERAEQQVVIACRRVDGLVQDAEMQDALTAAVARGVRVHLLWGEAKAKFADSFSALRALLELLAPNEQKVGGLFVSERPSGLSGSALACDLRQVCLGRHEWFDPRRGRDDVSVLLPSIAGPTDGARRGVPTAVIEAVQALRQACPEARFRRVIMADATLDGARTILGQRSLEQFPSAPMTVIPLAIGIWKNEWESWLAAAGETRDANRRTVMLVPRGGHRRLLVRAFEQARRRIVIMSPRLSDGLLGTAMEPHVRGALERGVKVTVGYTNILSRDDLTERLRDYRERGLQAIRMEPRGSFVVRDDDSIVSSFSFGGSDGERGLIEFGVVIRDTNLADHLAAMVSDGATDAPSADALDPSS